MYRDSSISRSRFDLALWIILKFEMSKLCLVLSEWFLMGDGEQVLNSRPVLQERPRCSDTRRNKFLCVCPMYLALQLKHSNWYTTFEIRCEGRVSLCWKRVLIDLLLTKIYLNIVSG